MSDATSTMLLIGVGGAGAAMARGINRAFGEGLRYLVADTDAATGQFGGAFVLLGGNRLSGRGAGGNLVQARLAAEDSIQMLDEHLEGVRLAVIVTALGGGTGGGATYEALRHLSSLGIPSIVFATMPFTFEGDDRQRNARGIINMIEEKANATFSISLDKLIGEVDNMNEAMQRAVDTLASGVTFFWRLIGHPGYLRLDAERMRQLLSNAGRGRFAAVTMQGEGRAGDAVDALVRSRLLSEGSGPVRAILCGILAGDDLRLSEVGRVADGVREAFGTRCKFELATVNDEETFAGRLAVVVMLFEASNVSGINLEAQSSKPKANSARHKAKSDVLVNMGRFTNVEQTVWNRENLDTPTYLRRGIGLDF